MQFLKAPSPTKKKKSNKTIHSHRFNPTRPDPNSLHPRVKLNLPWPDPTQTRCTNGSESLIYAAITFLYLITLVPSKLFHVTHSTETFYQFASTPFLQRGVLRPFLRLMYWLPSFSQRPFFSFWLLVSEQSHGSLKLSWTKLYVPATYILSNSTVLPPHVSNWLVLVQTVVN